MDKESVIDVTDQIQEWMEDEGLVVERVDLSVFLGPEGRELFVHPYGYQQRGVCIKDVEVFYRRQFRHWAGATVYLYQAYKTIEYMHPDTFEPRADWLVRARAVQTETQD